MSGSACCGRDPGGLRLIRRSGRPQPQIWGCSRPDPGLGRSAQIPVRVDAAAGSGPLPEPTTMLLHRSKPDRRTHGYSRTARKPHAWLTVGTNMVVVDAEPRITEDDLAGL